MTSLPKKLSPGLKLALDLGPLLVFFVLLLRVDIMAATLSYVVLAPIVLAIYWLVERKIPPMLLVSTALILVMGGLTLWLKDDTFIKMKPTLIYCLFAAVLTGSLLVKRLLIKQLMGSGLAMSDVGWYKLTYATIGLFLSLALANELVWRNFSDATWAGFKIAVVPITLVAFGLMFYALRNHMVLDAVKGEAEGGNDSSKDSGSGDRSGDDQ